MARSLDWRSLLSGKLRWLQGVDALLLVERAARRWGGREAVRDADVEGSRGRPAPLEVVGIVAWTSWREDAPQQGYRDGCRHLNP